MDFFIQSDELINDLDTINVNEVIKEFLKDR